MDWIEGDLVWFDPGVGYSIPGEIDEVHRAAQVIVVKAVIKGQVCILDQICCNSAKNKTISLDSNICTTTRRRKFKKTTRPWLQWI